MGRLTGWTKLPYLSATAAGSISEHVDIDAVKKTLKAEGISGF